jgi:hypothetical protein
VAYTITQLNSDLAAVLHGTTVNKITNLYGMYDRAASQLLLDINPQETIRLLPMSSTIYNGVYSYPLPADLKGNKVIDIRPQANRLPWNVYFQQYSQDFDRLKTTINRGTFNIKFNQGVKTILINAPYLLAPTILNNCDGVSDNGTWGVGSSASNLQADSINFVGSSASLSFNLAAGANPSTGYLENSTMSALNLSEVENQATLFLYTYLPTATDFTNVILRWGSSATDYYQVTTTVTQENTSFQDGWNLLAFPWLGATVVGSPDSSAINYVRVTWTYNGSAQTAVRLDTITSNLGSILDIEYYSKYMFRDAITGAFKERVTANTDIVNLDTETYMIYSNLVFALAAQQVQGRDALQYDGQFFMNEYKKGVEKYKEMYKSETQKPQTQYYTMPQRGYDQYNSGRWGY